MRVIIGSIGLVACATQTPPEQSRQPSLEEQLAALEQRWAQHPGTELPGEAPAVERDVEHLVDLWPEGAQVVPVMIYTQIRNRCQAPVEFVVGPEDITPIEEMPTNMLAAGEAISAGLAQSEWVHGLAPDGSWSLSASATGGWIVFTGDGPCDAVETETR